MAIIVAFVLCLAMGQLAISTGKFTDAVELVNGNGISNEEGHQPLPARVDRSMIHGKQDTLNHQGSSASKSYSSVSFHVMMNTHQAIHVVDRRYLSTGFGTTQLTRDNPDSDFNPKSAILQTLLRGLSPAVFRVGGRRGDQTFFSVNGSVSSTQRLKDYGTHTLTGEKWKILNEFMTKCGVDLAFTLNVIMRNGTAWDPTNTKELLDFNADLGYRVIWQLGNEPTLFEKNYNLTIPASQLAKDFITLRGILSEDRYKFSNELVGPDICHLPIPNCVKPAMPEISQTNTAYLERFLRDAGDSINATTVHFYNMLGKDGNIKISNFTDPDVLVRARCEMNKLKRVIDGSMPKDNRVKWLGEISSVTNGGMARASNRYAGGFPILYNLGVAAQMGVSVFIYWNFLGGYYQLVSAVDNKSAYLPLPLYWVCYLHKRFLGTHVLSVSHHIDGFQREDMSKEEQKSHVHVFAHCTLVSSLYPAGAVTVMALNLHNNSKAMLHLTDDLANKNIDEYLLTPDEGNMRTINIFLNGQLLTMKNSTHFPDLIPRPLPVGSPIVLPPQTYGFYVIRDANAPVCRKNETKR